MKALLRACGLCALLTFLPAAWGQTPGAKIARVEIQHIGPANVADDLIRANIHIRPGDAYLAGTVDEDIRNLYATGLFYNIRVSAERKDEGLVLTYVVQAMPRLTDIKFSGNKKFSDEKLKKKLSSKIGEALNEQKLFSDSQAIQTMYQKSGYPGTVVEAKPQVTEASGRGTVTFEIKESPKVKITEVQFVGAREMPDDLRQHEHALVVERGPDGKDELCAGGRRRERTGRQTRADEVDERLLVVLGLVLEHEDGHRADLFARGRRFAEELGDGPLDGLYVLGH